MKRKTGHALQASHQTSILSMSIKYLSMVQDKVDRRSKGKMGYNSNGAYLSGSIIDVGWVRHAVCAVTHQMCRQALIKKCVVLLRNAWWVTQETLTHPTFGLS